MFGLVMGLLWMGPVAGLVLLGTLQTNRDSGESVSLIGFAIFWVIIGWIPALVGAAVLTA